MRARHVMLLFLFSIGLEDVLGDPGTRDPKITTGTIELLSYRASGYRYLIIDLEEAPPAGFEQPEFDDTPWRQGMAAFGSGGGCSRQALC